jgi:hypothetical protein
LKFSFEASLSDYIALRDALCARLTLFNGRRGNEITTMRISHFKDATSRRWVQQDPIQSGDENFLKRFLITYIPGKGNRMVPVIIPQDVVEGMQIIIDSDRRREVGVSSKNQFAFANTGLSSNHILGWPCINNLCKNAGVKQPNLLTATKQRHRLSTEFASLDLTEGERKLFFDHLGHEAQVNEHTYQHPLAYRELTTVGKQLVKFDGGKQCTAFF